MLKVSLEAVIGERRKKKKGKRKRKEGVEVAGVEDEENMEMEGRRDRAKVLPLLLSSACC
jgi:hypothetical protein